MNQYCFIICEHQFEKLCCTCAFCATSSTSWNFSDTVKSSFGGSWITERVKWRGRHIYHHWCMCFPPDTQKQEVILPWVQRPQAQCSTGSSNLWKTEAHDNNVYFYFLSVLFGWNWPQTFFKACSSNIFTTFNLFKVTRCPSLIV